MDCDPDASPFGSGSGESESPFTLCTPAHLDAIPANSTDHFAMFADIDVDGQTDMPGPIQNFGGTFDGQDHSIINFNATQGLFAFITTTGTVQNLIMNNATLTLSNPMRSGILAHTNEGAITSTIIQGRILPEYTSSDVPTSLGGLVGRNNAEGIIYSSTTDVEFVDTGTPAGNFYQYGGLVGENHGQILESGSYGDQFYAVETSGGLVAWNYGSITRSFSRSSVVGLSFAGGLVAVMAFNSHIEDSYATGSVLSGDLGGFVAHMNNNTSITRSYAAMEYVFSLGAYFGGLTGRHYSNVVVTDSYWDSQTSSQNTSVGGAPLTTAEFGDEANFSNWLFAPAPDHVWIMAPDVWGNIRPHLAWEFD